MQIARDLAGYTLGGADLLRRAMGKKKPEEMAKQRAIFVKGAIERGVAEETAQYIFDLMEKFTGYGFNKSHSAAYAWVAYQTAWLKAHYPAAFMAAVLSSDMDNTDKLVGFVAECRNLGLTLLAPDINRSDYRFTVLENGVILYGLGAIKGVGQAAIEDILKSRDQGGPFQDLYDFCRRIDLRKANRRVLEALIRAGALDGLGTHRAQLLADLGAALQAAEQHHRLQALGQNDLFGSEAGDTMAVMPPPTRKVSPWSLRRLLEEEKAVLGFYLSGHPLDEYREELRHFVTTSLQELTRKFEGPGVDTTRAVVAGLVVELRLRRNKQGQYMAFAALDDGRGRLEVAIFAEVLEGVREWVEKDRVLVVEGEVARDDFSGNLRLVAEKVWTVVQAREHFAKGLWIEWPGHAGEASRWIQVIAAALENHRGGRCPVYIDYRNGKAQTCLQLGTNWRIRPDDELLGQLAACLGRERVRLHYG